MIGVKQICAVLLAGSWVLSATGSANTFSNIYVFGDSLSDTGNDLNLSGSLNAVSSSIPVFPAAPGNLAGRFSNGPVAVEYLASRLGLSVNPHYITPPALGGLTGGTNYAQGGALTGAENALLPSSIPGLGATGFKGISAQISDYLGVAGAADPNALYVVWGGPNDLLNSNLAPIAACTGSALPGVCTAVTNLANGIAALAGLGAQHILVPNLPDLGATPEAAALGLKADLHVLSLAFDSVLAGALFDLSLQFHNVVVPVDVFALEALVLQSPSIFGLTNVTDACLTGSSADATSVISPDCQAAGADHYLFWDEIHPTTVADRLLGQEFALALGVPEPGILALVALSALMLVGARKVRMPT